MSVNERSQVNTPVGTVANRDISVGNFWQEDLRASNYFDSKGFIKTPSAVASGDGNMLMRANLVIA
jgi:carotenoid cleavage dioxygenase-like enzyme